MTIELIGAILFFILTVFALIFSLTKSSTIETESFPNRGRFFTGIILWTLAAILAVFMSFPGYPDWFLPAVYPILKIALTVLFLVGFFMVLTTVNAFPLYMDAIRREVNGRSDRIAILENIRRITSQPYPITELFTLVLKELGSFLVLKKGAVFLINPSRNEMYLVAQIGLNREEMSRLERFPMGQDIISRTAAEQVHFISGDLAASDSATRKLILAGRDITLSAAVMPLSARDRSLGALLVLSDKPYRFEKHDRMLLNAAAEAIADEVETNRLQRETQKTQGQLDEMRRRNTLLTASLGRLATEADSRRAIAEICRGISERHGVTACRVVHLSHDALDEIVVHETVPRKAEENESYRIAIVDAIRRKKMVVLNQEARDRTGNVFVNRSTLLCPFDLQGPGQYALLIEAPGNGLPLTEVFLHEIEAAISAISVGMNISLLQEADSLSQTAVRALLNILEIKHATPATLLYQKFLEEIGRLLPTSSSALVFVPDRQSGYRVMGGCNIDVDTVTGITFLPGEGPIGKSAATGEVRECESMADVEKAWGDLEPVNQDFFGRLFGERGLPQHQLTIPIAILADIVAVVAVFDHSRIAPARREKGLLLLAAQLLSIKLSMGRMDTAMFENLADEKWRRTGTILNRINNDLATIIGRAQLLERQSDISGSTRYTTGEILKASESAAEAIKRMQEGMAPPQAAGESSRNRLAPAFEQILSQRHVTGNLYMFDDNRPVMLQTELDGTATFAARDVGLFPLLETVLRKFVALVEEGEEVFIKSELLDEYFYLSLVRGKRDQYARFQAAAHDFGSPDVLPEQFGGAELVEALNGNGGEVSFDRFGRRPTYLSFRFPGGSITGEAASSIRTGVTGLKILAIDDQQMILDLLTGICQSLGLELTAVQDPRQGMQLFNHEKFDIVMVDLVMGEISGWDVAREVKRKSPETPVVMMTGWGIALSAEETRRAGVDFTLAKPFKIEQLTDVINRARVGHISS